MKKLKNLLLPVAVVLIGAGAAFATNAESDDRSNQNGYFVDSLSGDCIESPMECSTVPGELCTWNDGSNTHALFQISGTTCQSPLYKPSNP